MKFQKFPFLLRTLFILLLCNIQMVDYCRAQCIPVNSCTGENFIRSFSTTGGITNITNNNSGCAPTGYTFYSNMECTQQAGQDFLFSFDNDNFHDAYIKFWVDWNANNVFTDPGEEVYAPPFSIAPSTNIAGPITVPAGTTPGIKRLRLRLSAVYGPTNDLTPCSPSATPQMGETEDYLVNVLPAVCNGTPPTATTLATATNVACNGTTKLSLQGSSPAIGLSSGTYQVITTTPFNCSITEQMHIGYLPVASVEGFNFIPQFFNALGQVKFSPLVPNNVDRYEWDFGDNTPISSQMNPTHTYAVAGAYHVTLRVYNECGFATKSLVINVDLTTGIVTANEDQTEIVFYPNPATDIIIIENKSARVKMEHINVYNMLGALIYSANADSFKKHQFSTRAFASAVYSIQIQLNNGILSKKIEVIH